MKNIYEHKILTEDEINAALDKMDAAQTQAERDIHRNFLVEHHMRVIGEATKKWNESIYIEDIRSELVFTLIDAIDKFDRNKGVKLITYVTKAIGNHVIRAASKNVNTIYISADKMMLQHKINKFDDECIARTGRRATIKQKSEKFDIQERTVSDLERATAPMESLHQPAYDDEGDNQMTKMDLLIDEQQGSYLDMPEEYDIKKRLMVAMKYMGGEKNIDILCSRYGFAGKRAKTRKEIAEELDTTPYYVEQLENKFKDKYYEIY